MLEIKFVRDNLAEVKNALSNRGGTADFEMFESSDAQRRTILFEIEELRHRRNVVSDKIAGMKKSGENADELIGEMRQVSTRIKALDKSLAEDVVKIENFLLGLPNIPHASVPVGQDASDNPVKKKVGELPSFDFEPKAHWDIGDHLGILDFDRAAKITGARFSLSIGAGARLERALINFMLDIQTTENGYTEILPPFMVNAQSMTNTGQLPKFEEDLFKIEGWNYFLIPTAEVPVTNIHQGEVLNEEDLPVLYTAYTPCFRSEAGSYGKDTRGLIRQHQFNKVELGDLGFSAAKTYDIEVWMPAQGVYREISSCSNFEAFQARRANIRFRRKGKKGTSLVHTLNGSGLAVGRTVAAILENYQQADGSVVIPEELCPYMGGIHKIEL